jgi:hypothetical protein
LCKDLRAPELACPPTRIPDLFFFALTIRPAILGSGSGFRDGCLLGQQGNCVKAVGQRCRLSQNRLACRSFPLCSSTTTGRVRFFSFPTTHLSSVREIVFTRKTGIASRRRRGQGGNVLCLFCFTFCTWCILYCLRSSPLGPLFPLALMEHRVLGWSGAGVAWNGC